MSRLQEVNLVTVRPDCHPLIREYLAMSLETDNEETWKAAHRRLYEHLSETTKEGDQPTLADLQPLYQAVAHGCHAGLQQKVCNELSILGFVARGKPSVFTALGRLAPT